MRRDNGRVRRKRSWVWSQILVTLSVLVLSGGGALGGCSDGSDEGAGGDITGGGGGGGETVDSQTFQTAVHATLDLGTDIAWLADGNTRFVAEAVLDASMQANGGTSWRVYGTLTQQGQTESFSYAPQPTDKLVVVLSNGMRVEILVRSLDGYTDGDMDDFLDSHHMEYNISAPGVGSVFTMSDARPMADGTIHKILTIQGTLESDVGSLQVDMSRDRTKNQKVEYDYADMSLVDVYDGTIDAPAFSIHLQERESFSYVAYNGSHSRNFDIQNISSFTIGGRQFSFQDVRFIWEDASVYNGGRNEDETRIIVISQPSYWEARGSVMEGNQVVGMFGFDGPVLEGSKGPDIILTLANGDQVPVLRPIERP